MLDRISQRAHAPAGDVGPWTARAACCVLFSLSYRCRAYQRNVFVVTSIAAARAQNVGAFFRSSLCVRSRIAGGTQSDSP